jgi:hypothetical protein
VLCRIVIGARHASPTPGRCAAARRRTVVAEHTAEHHDAGAAQRGAHAGPGGAAWYGLDHSGVAAEASPAGRRASQAESRMVSPSSCAPAAKRMPALRQLTDRSDSAGIEALFVLAGHTGRHEPDRMRGRPVVVTAVPAHPSYVRGWRRSAVGRGHRGQLRPPHGRLIQTREGAGRSPKPLPLGLLIGPRHGCLSLSTAPASYPQALAGSATSIHIAH